MARNDPFLQISSHAISRLKHLSVKTTPDFFQEIVRHLFRPAPLLEVLTIKASYVDQNHIPALAVELFDGDLSSLRELHLHFVRTELPWKNTSNLTSFSFSLASTSGPTISVEHFLDFFESSPRLVKVQLSFATPIPGGQGTRLVGLARLRTLSISGFQPPYLFLNHLIVPIGANVSTKFNSPGPRIEDHLPRSLENLSFTKIRLRYEYFVISVRFTGPNGQVSIASSSPRGDAERVVPRSLTRLDTSNTRCLKIVRGEFTAELHEALASLTNLHTLIISQCRDTHEFLYGLYVSQNRSLACPNLEELVFRGSGRFDMKSMVDIAAGRASAGAPLKSFKFIGFGEAVVEEQVTNLQKHVKDVEFSAYTDDEDSDEEH